LQQILIVCCCNCWALTLWTVCLSTEWAIGIWHSWLKHFNCWWKAVKNLICYLCIFNVQRHVHLKKWTLKFKRLYLKNYVSYSTKICSICCVNTHIQSLKVGLKSILSWLKYSIFSRGLFFIGAACIQHRGLNTNATNHISTKKCAAASTCRPTLLIYPNPNYNSFFDLLTYGSMYALRACYCLYRLWYWSSSRFSFRERTFISRHG